MSKIPKLPHFMDQGFHRAHRIGDDSRKLYDDNYDKIDWSEDTKQPDNGTVVVDQPGYTKITY